MDGRAEAPAGITVVNAIPCGLGSAAAIDAATTATVTLRDEPGVTATVADAPDADTTLVERCVTLVLEEYADSAAVSNATGATVRTDSEIPMQSGLKSSSAAANATVLATLDALDATDEVDSADAARLGVQAAREAGVTVTGAFDDASASMLGGVTVTDNDRDDLLARGTVDWDVLVWVPPDRAASAATDVERLRRVAGVAEAAADLALDGRYAAAMSVNGFAVCPALDRPAAPLLEALPDARGASLSGTGPSYAAVGDREALEAVANRWERRPGTTWFTTTRVEGARPT